MRGPCNLNCNSNNAWNPVDVDLLAATNYVAGYNYSNIDAAEYTAPQLLSWCCGFSATAKNDVDRPDLDQPVDFRAIYWVD